MMHTLTAITFTEEVLSDLSWGELLKVKQQFAICPLAHIAADLSYAGQQNPLCLHVRGSHHYFSFSEWRHIQDEVEYQLFEKELHYLLKRELISLHS